MLTIHYDNVYVLVIPLSSVVSTNMYPVAVVRSGPLAIAKQSTVASCYVCEVPHALKFLRIKLFTDGVPTAKTAKV